MDGDGRFFQVVGHFFLQAVGAGDAGVPELFVLNSAKFMKDLRFHFGEVVQGLKHEAGDGIEGEVDALTEALINTAGPVGVDSRGVGALQIVEAAEVGVCYGLDHAEIENLIGKPDPAVGFPGVDHCIQTQKRENSGVKWFDGGDPGMRL